MTNQLDTIIPRIVARGLLSLRQKAVFPQLVNSEFGAESAKRGDIIDVPLSQEIIAQDVQPSHNAPEPPDVQMQSAKVELKHWQKAAFHLSDKEMDQIEANDSFIPLQMAEAIGALARAVNQSIIDVMHDSPTMVGSFMKNGFARVGTDKLALDSHEGMQPVLDARRQLNGSFAPKSNRSFVLNYDNEAALLGLTNGLDATKAGETAFGLEGEIGRRLGFDFFATDNLEAHGDDVLVGALANNYNANITNFTVKLIAGNFAVGDEFSIAGHKGDIHEVTGHTGSAANRRLAFQPATKLPIEAGTHIASPKGKTGGFAFHRDAVALAMRPLSSTGMVTGHNGQMMTITDPESGLSLRLEVTRQYKQTVWEFDLLWGVALVKPSYVVRLYGG